MKYELTPDLLTNNALIDREHRELLTAVNKLFDACSAGKGRAEIESTIRFLNDYVIKHFKDEETLQKQYHYPQLATHHAFHENYKSKLASVTKELLQSGTSITTLSNLNQIIGILITHIKTDDKKLAEFVKTK